IMTCQWASMRPGISVRPPPSTTVTPGALSMVPDEMRSIWLPRTRTLLGPESAPCLPSKILTLRNNVTSGVGAFGSAACACGGAAGGGGDAADASLDAGGSWQAIHNQHGSNTDWTRRGVLLLRVS